MLTLQLINTRRNHCLVERLPHNLKAEIKYKTTLAEK